MTNTNLLKAKIKENGFKYGFLADQLGISAYGLANKMNNKTEFKATEIQTLCRILKIDSLTEKEAIFFDQRVEN